MSLLLAILGAALPATQGGLDVVQERIMNRRVTHLQPNDPALRMSFPVPGKIRVHTLPVRYGDPAGVQRPIEIGLRRVANEWVEDRNTIGFRARDDGSVAYRVGDHVLRMYLVSRVMYRPTVQVEEVVKTPIVTRPDGSRVRWTGVLGSEFEIEHEVKPGIIKERITLPVKPPLGTSEIYRLVWQWQSPTLTPFLFNDAINWRDSEGTIWVCFPAPRSWDADDQEIPSGFILEGDRIGIQARAEALRVATYPVTIDPTATTGSGDVTDSACIYEEAGSNDEYTKAFVKFVNLPDLTGYTIDAATVWLYGEETETSDTYTLHFDITGAWTGASSVGTLDALVFNASTDSDTGSTLDTWQENIILGDATKGLQKIYTDASMDPSALTATLMIRHSSYGSYSADAAHNGLIMVGYKGDARWAEDDDATHYPYIDIDYSSAAAGHTRTTSGTVGVLTF